MTSHLGFSADLALLVLREGNRIVTPIEDRLQGPRAAAATSSVAGAPAPGTCSVEEANDRPTPPNARHALLREEPVLVGESWARTWCETMRTEGRGVQGGWPGTVPEARARILQHLDGNLARRGMSPLSEEELLQATSVVYASAKRDWLRMARGEQASSVSPGARRRKS